MLWPSSTPDSWDFRTRGQFRKCLRRARAWFRLPASCPRLKFRPRGRWKREANMSVMGKSQRRILQRSGRCALAVVFLAGTITQQTAGSTAQGTPGWVKLNHGRVLKLVLNTGIDSQTSKVGDRLELQLAEPVTSENETVMPAGSRVSAYITKVRRARTDNCKAGLVAWKLDAMKFPDGTEVKL